MGRHLTACDLSVAAIGGAPGLPDGALHPKAGQYDEKHSGENTPYSIVAVRSVIDTERRQLTKMGPTSCYVTKATYSGATP